MELVNIIKWTIKILGAIPLIVVLFLWSQGYVDEFYSGKNKAEWVNVYLSKYNLAIKLYWVITIAVLSSGYFIYFKNSVKSIGFVSIFSTISIIVALIIYLIVIKEFPKAGP